MILHPFGTHTDVQWVSSMAISSLHLYFHRVLLYAQTTSLAIASAWLADQLQCALVLRIISVISIWLRSYVNALARGRRACGADVACVHLAFDPETDDSV